MVNWRQFSPPKVNLTTFLNIYTQQRNFWICSEFYAVALTALLGVSIRFRVNNQLNSNNDSASGEYGPCIQLFYSQPYIITNIVACFLMGFFTANQTYLTENISPAFYQSLTSGLCGAVATFSAWINDSVVNVYDREWYVIFIMIILEFCITWSFYLFGIGFAKFLIELHNLDLKPYIHRSSLILKQISRAIKAKFIRKKTDCVVIINSPSPLRENEIQYHFSLQNEKKIEFTNSYNSTEEDDVEIARLLKLEQSPAKADSHSDLVTSGEVVEQMRSKSPEHEIEPTNELDHSTDDLKSKEIDAIVDQSNEEEFREDEDHESSAASHHETASCNETTMTPFNIIQNLFHSSLRNRSSYQGKEAIHDENEVEVNLQSIAMHNKSIGTPFKNRSLALENHRNDRKTRRKNHHTSQHMIAYHQKLKYLFILIRKYEIYVWGFLFIIPVTVIWLSVIVDIYHPLFVDDAERSNLRTVALAPFGVWCRWGLSRIPEVTDLWPTMFPHTFIVNQVGVIIQCCLQLFAQDSNWQNSIDIGFVGSLSSVSALFSELNYLYNSKSAVDAYRYGIITFFVAISFVTTLRAIFS